MKGHTIRAFSEAWPPADGLAAWGMLEAATPISICCLVRTLRAIHL